jgi:NAD(P)-dependent dehydrogenase (short-subunit alcohol dehydrogenase family)
MQTSSSTMWGRPTQPFGDLTDDDWLGLFQLNVMSGVRMTRHYLPKMVERGWDRVVFISSESALAIPKEMIDYGMTKTAQLAISRGVAESVAGTGVTVNAVLPGPTRSEILDKWMKAQSRGTRHNATRGRATVLEDRAANDADQSVRYHRRGGEHGGLRLFGASLGDHRRRLARRRWRLAVHRLVGHP